MWTISRTMYIIVRVGTTRSRLWTGASRPTRRTLAIQFPYLITSVIVVVWRYLLKC